MKRAHKRVSEKNYNLIIRQDIAQTYKYYFVSAVMPY